MACIQYVVMIHLSERVRLIKLKTEHKAVCKTFLGNSQTLKTAYLFNIKTIKYSRTKIYENATLLSLVLCCKHYVHVYLDEYLDKTLAFCRKQNCYELSHPI